MMANFDCLFDWFEKKNSLRRQSVGCFCECASRMETEEGRLTMNTGHVIPWVELTGWIKGAGKHRVDWEPASISACVLICRAVSVEPPTAQRSLWWWSYPPTLNFHPVRCLFTAVRKVNLCMPTLSCKRKPPPAATAVTRQGCFLTAASPREQIYR